MPLAARAVSVHVPGSNGVVAARADGRDVDGLAGTPLALSGVEALGLRGGCEVMLPLVAGATAVILAAAVACTPALVQAARVAPAELLRREQVESVE